MLHLIIALTRIIFVIIIYDFIQKEELSSWEYYYGISYLSLLGFVLTIYSTYTLVKNRNDYVKLNNGLLSYKDNNI